jgi:hypothetical protein
MCVSQCVVERFKQNLKTKDSVRDLISGIKARLFFPSFCN